MPIFFRAPYFSVIRVRVPSPVLGADALLSGKGTVVEH